jgi:hypothetical protein
MPGFLGVQGPARQRWRLLAEPPNVATFPGVAAKDEQFSFLARPAAGDSDRFSGRNFA